MASKNSNEVSGWVGWIGFAGVMLYMASFFHLIAGLVALFKDTVYVVGQNNLWALDYTQWGWIHVFWALLLFWAASSLMSGKVFGRTVAVVVAMLSAIVNMLFIPVYPIWSIMILVVDLCIIYAVIVHGGDLKD